MSDVQRYLLEAEKNKLGARNIALGTAQQLETKRIKLIDLITSLSEYINKKDDSVVRANTVAFLADVLTQLPPRSLTVQERLLLCEFLLGRIEGDVEGIGSTAKGLMALEGMGRWDSSTAQKVMTTFLRHTSPVKQFKLQSERYAIIQLIDLLVAKYRLALTEQHHDNPELLGQIIQLFEGEKDPRNLMIIFSLMQVPMTEWDIHPYTQDLFESVFNYFPITFKPPPDDPYGITAQDLKDRLRQCISSTAEFAPHAIPALLDKLDSTSMNTKRDVLQALQDCIVNYGGGTINLYSVPLWDALKFEVLAAQEDDLALEALKALGLIAAKLVESSDGAVNAYLRPIIKECKEHFEDAPTKQSHAAGRILHAVASGSPVVADKLVKVVIPTLMDLFRASDSASKQRGLLEGLNDLLRAFAEMQGAGDKVMLEGLQSFGSKILDLNLKTLDHASKSEVSLRLASLDGLVLLSRISTLLSSGEIDRAADAVTSLVLHEKIDGHGNVRLEALDRLIQLAHSQPEVVLSRCIPAFMVELPDLPSNEQDTQRCLEAFAQLSKERQVFDTVVLRLKNKYVAARQQGASKQYQHNLLKALLYAFVCGSPPQDNGVIRSAYFTQYAEPLVDQVQSQATTELDHIELSLIGLLCTALLRDQSHHFQGTVYNKHKAWLFGHDNNTGRLAPFQLQLYAALYREIVEPQDANVQLRHAAAAISDSSVHAASKSSIPRLVTVIVNKFVDGKALEETLTSANIDVQHLLSTQLDANRLGFAFAIIKATLLQGKAPKLTKAYLDQLLQLLPSFTAQQARLFANLLAPDSILSKENHCIISGLYKQKTYSQLVPTMVEAIRGSEPDLKQNYLIALSGILQWLPYSILQPNLHTLMAPLLQALDLDDRGDDNIKISALTIFESTLMHDPNAISEHATSLISRLLTTSAEGQRAHVRAKSLQCLALVPKQLKREIVVKYRRQVVKKLLACLDDGRRNVRAEAVRCRTNWLALEEAEAEQ